MKIHNIVNKNRIYESMILLMKLFNFFFNYGKCSCMMSAIFGLCFCVKKNCNPVVLEI